MAAKNLSASRRFEIELNQMGDPAVVPLDRPAAAKIELCRHTEWRLRRSGRHFGVNLAEFFGVFVK
jgi:hypothetical protein